ncbi:hypothetical protein [Xanthomonas graminis]|uniref:hypothetical protein n=1 Tax=Xanthomonas graminis TaxID=3390026 RepID=UPI0039647D5A
MSVKTLGHWVDAVRTGGPSSSPSRKPVAEMERESAQRVARMPGSQWSARS